MYGRFVVLRHCIALRQQCLEEEDGGDASYLIDSPLDVSELVCSCQ